MGAYMIEISWINDWAEARACIKRLGGCGKFKSVLFRQMFAKGPYPCKFLILTEGGRLRGAMTCWYSRRSVAPSVHHIWMVGDFDTAKGTHGMGRKLLETFMQAHGRRFTLGCWDDVAERFWRHMADAYGLSVSEIGKTPWGYPRLLFQQI